LATLNVVAEVSSPVATSTFSARANAAGDCARIENTRRVLRQLACIGKLNVLSLLARMPGHFSDQATRRAAVR